MPDPQPVEVCRICGHPHHCHEPANKQDDGRGGACCVRCYNDDGAVQKAWHVFEPEPDEAAS